MTLNMSHSVNSSSYRAQSEPVTDRHGKQKTVMDGGERCAVFLKRSNSVWDMAGEQRAALNEAQRLKPHRTLQGQQLYANQLYGTAYEAHVARALSRDPRFTQVDTQVSITPKKSGGAKHSDTELTALNKQSGATTRADFIAKHRGEYTNIECKGSDTAQLTSNQRAFNGLLDSRGAQVTSSSNQHYKGTDLGHVPTIVVRPSTEDGHFAREVLVPTAPPPPRPPRQPEDPIYGRRW